MQPKIISQQMLTSCVTAFTAFHHFRHLSSGYTSDADLQFSCFKCQPAADYAARFAIKGASQKNLKHLEGKGAKVLFLKGIHYHNKEFSNQTSLPSPCGDNTAVNLGRNYCNVDWEARKKKNIYI